MSSTTPVRRPRDAAATRALLLDAALRRFTVDGYAATTVRHIADDAGVNVALINRYFTSKEGLFEACLTAAVAAMKAQTGTVVEGFDGMAEAMSRQAVGRGPDVGPPHALLLLLRSSGDPAAERVRLGFLRTLGERLAGAARQHGAQDDTTLLLRAQVVLATAVGIAVLKASGGLDPLSSATDADLVGPLGDLIDAVLRRPPGEG